MSRDRRTVAARQLLRRGGIDIDDRMEPGIRVTGDILRVDGTDAAGTELAELIISGASAIVPIRLEQVELR